MVLCYRRMLYGAGTVSQTMEHFLAGPQHAVAYFGAIPHQVMGDKLQAAGLKRAVGDAPVLTPRDADFAAHNGLRIVPCHVGTGNAKGRVENGVGDVKKNCLAGLDLPDFSALHPAARQWLETVANVRLPGATRHKPTALWHPEKSALHPLPMHPFAIATVSQVRASRQCRLPLDTHRSSVPAHLAGHALTLQTSPDRLCLSLGEHLIARPVRSDDRYGDFEDPDHPKPLLAPRKKARAHQLFMRFLALSPRAAASSLTLEQRRLTPHQHVRKLVALRDIYGQEAVARAMADAVAYEAVASDDIANWLEPRARFIPAASALHLPRRAALLAVRLQPPALSIYHATAPPAVNETEESHPMEPSTEPQARAMPPGDGAH